MARHPCLESLAAALSPLEDLTDFLSGDTHIIVSSLIPVLYNLANKINIHIQAQEARNRTIGKDTKLGIGDYRQVATGGKVGTGDIGIGDYRAIELEMINLGSYSFPAQQGRYYVYIYNIYVLANVAR